MPGLYSGINPGTNPRGALVVEVVVFVVGVGPGTDAPVVMEEGAGSEREPIFGSAVLGVVLAPVLVAGVLFNDSVLRPAWNLRSAANAAASLAL